MYRIGLDIGSTTIKCVVLDDQDQIVYKSYQRHRALIKEKTEELLSYISENILHENEAKLSITGSAGIGVAEKYHIPFVQEVIATQVAVESYPETIDVVIELGGEDAKILFLTNGVEVRMNGTCAGGTGAFIDQMAVLLDVDLEEMDRLASEATQIYAIASRCGVFAKSDIQPLLNQGASKANVAASIFQAVVNQTIGGLAQGRDLVGRMMFLGGPLTFLKSLQKSFIETLDLSPENGIFPENAQYYVAYGAALYSGKERTVSIKDTLAEMAVSTVSAYSGSLQPLFRDEAEYDAFIKRHQANSVPEGTLEGYAQPVYIGIDAGSTTAKMVVVGQEDELLYSKYVASNGQPIQIVLEALQEIYAANPEIKVAASAVTGYGEELIKHAFQVDMGVVETVAHLTAAQKFMPEVDFIIDIGGQDIKCFKIRQHIIDTIFLNEACSSGCGSFISTFASALGYSVEEFAKLGLFAKNPVDLGSRCTVFMNSSVKQAQKEGASVEDISAGLSISVVKNALYKVIRANSKEDLGKNIVVQGGTFLNDSILRAFEMEVEGEVVRPQISGLMGAYGAALYAKKSGLTHSGVLNAQELAQFTHQVSTRVCQLCGNHCQLTINTFSKGEELIAGNRCERPVKASSPAVAQEALKEYNAYKYKRQLISQKPGQKGASRGQIGIPLGLNMYENYHFWQAFFTALDIEVVHTPFGSRSLYLKGQHTIPSDTVCYPAKLMHGHIEYLLEHQVKRIFYPCLAYNFDEQISDNHYNCPVVAYYPEVLKANVKALQDAEFIMEYVGPHQPKHFAKAMHQVLAPYYQVSKREITKAVQAALAAHQSYLEQVKAYGVEAIRYAREHHLPIVVLVGRPYHIDPEINHGIDQLITSFGAVVISEDALPLGENKPLTHVLNQWTYHARLYNAAEYICEQEDMYLVQLVSFGCGLDAVTTDEVREILERKHHIYTQIKIDEINNLGAVKIRLRSLFAAIEQQRKAGVHHD